jgi:hypothetical protein
MGSPTPKIRLLTSAATRFVDRVLVELVFSTGIANLMQFGGRNWLKIEKMEQKPF